MSYQLTAWAVKQKTGSVTRKAVLMALANCASHHTGLAEPLIDKLADETELSERTVRRALDDLEAANLISREMKHDAKGHRAGYIYSFPLPDRESARDDAPSGQPVQSLPDTVTGQELQEVQGQEDLPPDSPPGQMGQILARSAARHVSVVAEAWQAHSPPLISHRDSYLADPKTQTAIRRALRVYPVEVVTEAVANYAAVLGGDEYRWNYRWTIIDFLKRGLDRFVPEATPLENFRINGGPPTKFGRRDVSARELLDAADRLEAEQGKQWGQLESG